MSSSGVADTQPVLQTINLRGEDNLTALAGGGQGSTWNIDPSATFHRVTTVANANDSITLPPAKTGAFYILTNAHASNGMNVYPYKGDAINALGANGAFAMGAGKVALYFCVTTGQWHTLLTS